MNIKALLLLGPGLLLALWPFAHDHEALGCDISPLACTDGENIAFAIVLTSIVIGCLLIAVGLLFKLQWTPRKVIFVILIGFGLSLIDFITYTAIGFSHHFVF